MFQSETLRAVPVYLYQHLQLNLIVTDTTLPLFAFLLSSELLKFRRGEPLTMRQDARLTYRAAEGEKNRGSDRQTDRQRL